MRRDRPSGRGVGLWLATAFLLVALPAAQAEDMSPQSMPLQPTPTIHVRNSGGGEKGAKSACLNAHDVRHLVERGEVIPVHKAMGLVRNRLGGEVVKVRLCPEQEQLIYYLTLLDKNSQISVVAMDARTGHFPVRP